MKAIGLTEFGGLAVLYVVELSTPAQAAKRQLVRRLRRKGSCNAGGR
jgi:hypothetical protein